MSNKNINYFNILSYITIKNILSSIVQKNEKKKYIR